MSEIMDTFQKNLNKNRELLSKSIQVHKFYDKLRSKNVISFDDFQEIDNSKIYHTDSEKASHLLDVIATKGSQGYEVFLDCLDEYYPHLYKDVTGNEPTARPTVHSPQVGGTYNSVIDLDGVRDLTRQLDEHRRGHATDLQAISALREEVFKLRFINSACKNKLLRYPELVRKNKQMDLEIKDLKEWQLAMIIKNNDLEKAIAKIKFDRKEQKQMIDQLQQKLEDAVDMHQSQKHNWERTNSKNEQLTHAKNDLAKKLENVQREIETVKRQSSLWSSGSFQLSFDNSHQDPAAVIEILQTDLTESQTQCKELTDRLYKERSETETREMYYEKIEADNEELRHMHGMVQKHLELTDSNYQLKCQELQLVYADRNYAYEQRDQAQSDAREQRKEKEKLHHKLNEHLRKFKLSLYNPQANVDREELGLLSVENGGIDRNRPLRVSGYSDTSGISSSHTSLTPESGPDGKTTAEKSATLPSRWSAQDSQPSAQQLSKPISNDLQVEIRPRTIPLPSRNASNKKKASPSQNPFPENEIPLSPSVKQRAEPRFTRAEENDGDADDVSESDGLTMRDIASNAFANRQANFADSTRSDLAQQGSYRDKHYHERLDILRQSFKVRPPLDMNFSIDYDDESEDLRAIFADDIDTAVTKRSRKSDKACKRRSRSLTNLHLSSDDSDEGQTSHRKHPPTQRYRSMPIGDDFPSARRNGTTRVPAQSWFESPKISLTRTRLGARKSIPEGEIADRVRSGSNN